MRVTVLMENSTPSSRLAARHGLSLWLELEDGRRVLFDMGPDDAFLANARALDMDVTSADLAVLSHGHYDHGGGLRVSRRVRGGRSRRTRLRAGARRTLVSGCSHGGILNLMDAAEELAGAPLDAVVAGFHLMDPSGGTVEDAGLTRNLAREMASRRATYHTFHCTGTDVFSLLRDELGDRVRYLHVGSRAEA
ncbi:MAG: MBL fold metallo-hydrolase [Atopobiaceae bacterium]|nr:MBL fold metallo-hydrolase [Atopobiaceae bacterium]